MLARGRTGVRGSDQVTPRLVAVRLGLAGGQLRRNLAAPGVVGSGPIGRGGLAAVTGTADPGRERPAGRTARGAPGMAYAVTRGSLKAPVGQV